MTAREKMKAYREKNGYSEQEERGECGFDQDD